MYTYICPICKERMKLNLYKSKQPETVLIGVCKNCGVSQAIDKKYHTKDLEEVK